MNDRQSSAPPTLDELYQRKIRLHEEMAEIDSQIEAKQAEYQQALGKYRPASKPGRPPKAAA